MRTLTNTATKLKQHGALPALWLMTDTDRMPDPIPHVARLPRGSAVILRHYNFAGKVALAQRLAILCRARGISLIVAGDWRLAAQMQASGLHLPEYMSRSGLPAGARLWQRLGQRWLTVAAHDSKGLRRACALNASAAILAPVFPTRSHPNKAVLGAQRFGRMVRCAHVPVVALGGVDETTIASLMTSGCVGIAGIGFSKKA
jgi:thiamine-phosphate pyrophosphorylase